MTTVDFFVAMTNLGAECRALVRVAHASAAELYQENHCTGRKNCETVNSIRWCCWNIATDERDVDYWKSEVITLFKYIN